MTKHWMKRLIAGVMVFCMAVTGMPSGSLKARAEGVTESVTEAGEEKGSAVATVSKIWASFRQGDFGMEPDISTAVISDTQPAGKELIAKFVSGGKYAAVEEDKNITLILNNATTSVKSLGLTVMPESWEMSGNSAISFGNMVMRSKKANFPAYAGEVNVDELMEFYNCYPYEDDWIDEDEINWRLYYDCEVSADYVAKGVLLARELVVDEGATLTLDAFKTDWSNNQLVGGMFNGDNAIINGTVVLVDGAPEYAPLFGFYNNGSLFVGENGGFVANEGAEIVFGDYTTCEGLQLFEYGDYEWDEEAYEYVQTIDKFEMNENHGRESFFWDEGFEAWVRSDEYPPANGNLMLRFEEHESWSEEYSTVVKVDGEVVRSGDEVPFEVGKKFTVSLKPYPDRAGCTPVVVIKSGFGPTYRQYSNMGLPSDMGTIRMAYSDALGAYWFDFTPTSVKGLLIEVYWSEYDFMSGDDESVVIEVKRGWGQDEVNGKMVWQIDVDTDQQPSEVKYEPNDCTGVKYRFPKSLFEDGESLTLTFTPAFGKCIGFINSNAETGFYCYDYSPYADARHDWLTSMEGTAFAVDGWTISYTFSEMPKGNDVYFGIDTRECPGSIYINGTTCDVEYRLGATGEFTEFEADEWGTKALYYEDLYDVDEVTLRYTPDQGQTLYGVYVTVESEFDPYEEHYYPLGEGNVITLYKGERWKNFFVEPLYEEHILDNQYVFRLKNTKGTVTFADGKKLDKYYTFKPGKKITFTINEPVYKVIAVSNYDDEDYEVAAAKTVEEEVVGNNGVYTFRPKNTYAGIEFRIYLTEEMYEFDTAWTSWDEVSAIYYVETIGSEEDGGEVAFDVDPIRVYEADGWTKLIFENTSLVHLEIDPYAGFTYNIYVNGEDVTQSVSDAGDCYEWNLSDSSNVPIVRIEFVPENMGGITITKQPVDWYGEYGKKASFSVVAEGNVGSVLTYQWQYKKSGNWIDYAITTADTANFKVTMNEKNVKWPIRCLISDGSGNEVTTDEVWMKLKSEEPAPVSAITITKQPVDWYGEYGKKASFSVEAEGLAGSILTYQWQYKKSGTWSDYAITTGDTANFKVTMNEKNVKWALRCKISDMAGNIVYTNEVWMKLKSEEPAPVNPITITKQPADWYGTYGKKASFSVEATGNGLSYQWQYKKSGTWNDYAIDTANTANFKVTMNEKNVKWALRCKITDANGNEAYTNEVYMKLKEEATDPIVITSEPADWYGTYGKKASFNVTAQASNGGTLTYQWQYKKGTTWANYDIATADTPNFKVTMNEKNVKWSFRCVITDEAGNVVYTREAKMYLQDEGNGNVT